MEPVLGTMTVSTGSTIVLMENAATLPPVYRGLGFDCISIARGRFATRMELAVDGADKNNSGSLRDFIYGSRSDSRHYKGLKS